MSAAWRTWGRAVRERLPSTSGKSTALVLVVAAVAWITVVPVGFGIITPEAAVALAVSDLGPIAILAALGLAIGSRRGTALERALAQLRTREADARELVEASGDGILVSDASGRYVEVNPAFCRMLGYSRDELLGMRAGDLTAADDPVVSEGMDRRLAEAVGGIGILAERRYRKRDGGSLAVEVRFRVLPDGRQQRNVRDITERVAAEEERARLVAAVEQTADAVWMHGLDGNVVFVNRSFSRLYGYEPDEIVGRHAGIIDSGRQERAFFDAIWASAAAGKTWTGSIVNRRKDGTLLEVEAVISGIRDASGRLASFMQTDRDVTRERALETTLARRARERDMIEAALDRIDPGSTPEAIAADACAEMVRLPSVDSAFVIALAGEDDGLILGVEGPVAAAFASNRVIPGPRARYLLERASVGVWTEEWRARAEDGSYGDRVTATGLRTVAYAPLRGPSGVIGVVGLGIHGRARDAFVEQLPVLTTLASMLGTLQSPGLEARNREGDVRASVQAILDTEAFTPFFQPIVELRTGKVVGYEALSRFSTGVAPDLAFGLATRSGLGLELEAATLRAALEASAVLPGAAYLSLNASPALIGSGRLRAILGGHARRLFLEITEHVVIDDYQALRDELAALGRTVGLSVDDAGAGYASLRHILELSPDLVKLDIGLIRGIDADPARQALIAGMGYFAVKRKLRLVAEGVETAAELEALQKLGIGYGQGYILGRPQDGRGPGPWPTKIPLPGVSR